MRVLAIDVETTGFPSSSKPNDHPDQPYIVQVGLVERFNGKIVTEMSYLVQCPIEIPEGAGKVHGITDEDCRMSGCEAETCIDPIVALVDRADVVVGHNIQFDCRMFDIAAARFGRHEIKWPDKFCTMKEWASIIGGKWPKLEAAYNHVCSLGHAEHIPMREHHALDDARKALVICDYLQTRDLGQIV